MRQIRENGNLAPITCDQCGTAGKKLQHCGRCRISLFCGSDCQKAAWGKHRDFCFEAVRKVEVEVVGDAGPEPGSG